MNTIIKIIEMILSSSISVILYTLCYTTLANIKLKVNLKNILLIILEGIIFILNNKFILTPIFSILCTIISLSLLFYLFHKDKFQKIILKTIFICIVAIIFEIAYPIILIKINMFESSKFENSLLIKNIFSVMVLISTYIIFNIKKIVKLINDLIANDKDNMQSIVLFLIIISLTLIDLKYVVSFDSTIYYANLFITACFIVIFSFSIYFNYKAKRQIEKNDILLDFMKKYEKAIDEDRIKRHEMLNNLLILKSFKNKNTKEYEETLNELIDNYNNKRFNSIKNIYKLPSGLKGIIYYKMKDAQMVNVNFEASISNKISSRIRSLNNKEYTKLCKIVGIVIDNAIEAASISEKKVVLLESYIDHNNVIINISNSCKKKIDLDKINEKNYSTKGKNRGLGLYIASNLVKSSSKIDMNQSYNNLMFNTELIIK